MKLVKDIIDQFVDCHMKDQNQKIGMPYEEARKYFMKLLANNIIYYEENGELLGYVEFWKLTYEQWGKIVCHEHFSAYHENVTDGNVAYVANVWVREDKRRSHVIKFLTLRFFEHCHNCTHYVGEALRKTSSQPIKVFKREHLKSRLFKRGVG